MTLRYYGEPDQFKGIIRRISRFVYWHEPANDCLRCDLDRGVVVQWWLETRTVLFQGPHEAASRMKANFVVLGGYL